MRAIERQSGARARLAAAPAPAVHEQCDALTTARLRALPDALALRICSVLPCDVRLRCREVCRAWRDALGDARLWTVLDLSVSSGVVARVTPALLRAAAARASGRMERLLLRLDEAYRQYPYTTPTPLEAALHEVVAANADTLRLLCLRGVTYDMLESLLRVAPRQCVVEADASCGQEHGRILLRSAAPFEAVRLRSLEVIGFSRLSVRAAALFADALRSNNTLTALTVHEIDFWRNADVATQLLGALVGHASLTRIKLWAGARADASATVGALLGALVAANSPQLRVLDISASALGEIGLGPLVDALSRNMHLRELHCTGCASCAGSGFMQDAFERNRLMPALAANTSLRTLSSDSKRANDFIAARTVAANAAAARARLKVM